MHRQTQTYTKTDIDTYTDTQNHTHTHTQVCTSPEKVSILSCSLRRNPCGTNPKLPWRALATSEWGQEELVSGTSIHHSAVEPSEMNQTYSG